MTLPNEDKTEYTTQLLKSVGYKVVEQETGGYRFLTHKNRYSIEYELEDDCVSAAYDHAMQHGLFSTTQEN